MTGKYCGEKSYFWGKTHTDETRKLISEKGKSNYLAKTDEQRARDIENLAKGREAHKGKAHLSNFEYWEKKSGKAYAEKRQKQANAIHSKNNSGKGNPMYGKPSPKGSGNGWKCYLDSIFCRSLREALFIATSLDGIPFETGEYKKYRIEYLDWEGVARTYRPDFVTDKYIYECKPKRLWKSPSVKSKAIAGVKFAKSIGKIYKLVDIEVDFEIVKSLVESGRLKLLPRYQEKYEIWIKSH